MKKKKSLSILGIVAAVLLLIVVLITLTLNVLFSQHDTPKIFGNYVRAQTVQPRLIRVHPFMQKQLLSVRHTMAANRFPRTMRFCAYWHRKILLLIRTRKVWQSAGF